MAAYVIIFRLKMDCCQCHLYGDGEGFKDACFHEGEYVPPLKQHTTLLVLTNFIKM